MSGRFERSTPGGIWVLDEAMGLLRALPARSWTVWLGGSLPFIWALVDFLLDMARSRFDAGDVAVWSAVLALLYAVKHTAQAIFARDCLRVLHGEPLADPEPGSLLRLFLVQSAVQPFRWPVLAIASIAVLPVPWVVAFFRNLGLATLESERGMLGSAWRIARGDTKAHSVALSVLTLAGLLLFLNLGVLWFFLPMLLRALFGVQTEFARMAAGMFNLTTVTVTAILAGLALEPAGCALAALRVFHQRAVRDGEDLRGALRRLPAAAAVLCVIAAAMPALAQDTPPDMQQMGQTIERVFERSEFAWKTGTTAPRHSAGWVDALLNQLQKWAGRLLELIRDLFGSDDGGAVKGPVPGMADPAILRFLMIFAALLAAVGIVVLLRGRRRSRRKKLDVEVPVPVVEVDVADESVTAERLAEDAWLRLAEEHAGRGEFRLAMRAVHLGGLRALGERGWITLQPAKTGLEYARELERRTRELPEVTGGYRGGLRQFEAVWYGFGTADQDGYQQLRQAWEAVRSHA